jgi:hypothetical protein
VTQQDTTQTDTTGTDTTEDRTSGPDDDGRIHPATAVEEVSTLRRVGRTSWALLGILLIAAVIGYVLSLVPLVVIPVVLALFPATLLVPVAGWLRRIGAPDALAAIASILLGFLLIGAIIGAMIPLVAAQAPELAESASDGLQELENFLSDGPLGLEIGGVDDLIDMAQEQLGEVGELAPQAMEAAVVAFEVFAGLLLLFVVLFFYLKDGPRLANGIITTAPRRYEDASPPAGRPVLGHAREVLPRADAGGAGRRDRDRAGSGHPRRAARPAPRGPGLLRGAVPHRRCGRDGLARGARGAGRPGPDDGADRGRHRAGGAAAGEQRARADHPRQGDPPAPDRHPGRDHHRRRHHRHPRRLPRGAVGGRHRRDRRRAADRRPWRGRRRPDPHDEHDDASPAERHGREAAASTGSSAS